jgi:hypothetical protein
MLGLGPNGPDHARAGHTSREPVTQHTNRFKASAKPEALFLITPVSSKSPLAEWKTTPPPHARGAVDPRTAGASALRFPDPHSSSLSPAATAAPLFPSPPRFSLSLSHFPLAHSHPSKVYTFRGVATSVASRPLTCHFLCFLWRFLWILIVPLIVPANSQVLASVFATFH